MKALLLPAPPADNTTEERRFAALQIGQPVKLPPTKLGNRRGKITAKLVLMESFAERWSDCLLLEVEGKWGDGWFFAHEITPTRR